MQDSEKTLVLKKLNGLTYVPPGEVDDTRFEMFFSDLSQYTQKGPAVFNDFLSLGAIDAVKVGLVASLLISRHH